VGNGGAGLTLNRLLERTTRGNSCCKRGRSAILPSLQFPYENILCDRGSSALAQSSGTDALTDVRLSKHPRRFTSGAGHDAPGSSPAVAILRSARRATPQAVCLLVSAALGQCFRIRVFNGRRWGAPSDPTYARNNDSPMATAARWS
jgi:hypothetical protein